MTIRYSIAALASLQEMETWNVQRYGRAHADRYLDFLDGEVARLVGDPELGRPLLDGSGRRYLVVRRRNKGYGHIAVYRARGEAIEIIDIFHTSQDWSGRLDADLP